MSSVIAVGCLIAAAAAAAFMVVLVRAGTWRTNRLLVALIGFEGLLQLVVAIGELGGEDSPISLYLFPLILLDLALLSWCYFVFIGRLGTPLVRPTRPRWVRALVGIVLVGSALALLLYAYYAIATGVDLQNQSTPADLLVLIVFVGVIVVSLWALVASIHAWARAPRGSPERARGAAFALAFCTRDALLAGGLFLSEFTDGMPDLLRTAINLFADASLPLATLFFVPLLAYGILRTQLFDIDLRIKTGIRRSTVVTIMLVVVLATAKTSELYLSRTFGWVAGGIAAGIMLVLAPRLNKIGDKVANAALPQVQATPAYVAFKKLEVYKAAVESALGDDQRIGERERAVLERLRGKLGLNAEDASAVEKDVLSGA